MNQLDRSLIWRSPREAEFRTAAGTTVSLVLVLGSKSRPDHVVDLYARLAAHNVSEELLGDIFSSIFLPKERVYEAILDGVEDPPGALVDWAVAHGWQVEEYPGPGRFWPS
ncbi:MAG: hypothetical protein FIB06_01460 [Betaproteobacteria bacterium]|nr:hypothetical protein [Betaproteobacteria bacterium]